MKVDFEIIKILAVGCDKRYMWIRQEIPLNALNKTMYVDMCVRIKGCVYQRLKNLGVPTSQSLRKKNNK